MPTILLTTQIKAPIEICFDLSRSVDLHIISTAHTNEKAIAGKTTGLVDLHDTITWQATHLGIRQRLTSKITGYERPHFFTDEQVKGAFKGFVHDHYFEQSGDIVTMKDVFQFESPFGILGRLFNAMYLTQYMKKLLVKRNETIKAFAESGRYMKVLGKIRP